MTALSILVPVAAVGAGLMAGLFFAFSTSVMPGLGLRPPAEAAAAMQAMNVRIQNPLFLLVFLGSALAGLAVAVLALVTGGSGLHVAGGLLVVAGSFGITMGVNVPMNNRLDREGEPYWAEYARRWTVWNNVRAGASAAALLLLALG